MSWKYDRLKWCPTSCWPVSYGPPRMFMLIFRSHLSTNLITPALVNKLQPCFTTCQRNLRVTVLSNTLNHGTYDDDRCSSNLMKLVIWCPAGAEHWNICTFAKISAPWPNEASCRISAEGVRRYQQTASVPTTVPLPMLVACAADLYWQLVTTDPYPSGYNIERWP